MGKKSARKAHNVTPTPTMLAVQRQRQLQAAKDKRRRLIIIGVIVAVLVIIIALVAGMIAGKYSGNTTASGETPKPPVPKGLDVPGTLPNMIAVGKGGVGKAVEGVPTINRYFSYGCPGCLGQDHQIGPQLNKLALEGKINMVLYPVATHPLPWTYVAGDAAMRVAAEDPEHFLKFHEAMIAFAFGVMNKDDAARQSQGNGTILADAAGALNEVKKLAKQVGVPAKVVNSFQPMDAVKGEMDAWTQKWTEIAKPLVGGEIGTPMTVKGKKEVVNFSNFVKISPQKNDELKELQKSDPKKYMAEAEKINEETNARILEYMAKK